MNKSRINGVIFDYGGTLDTRGDHWSEVIYDGYCQCDIAIDKMAYRDAYVYGERALAVNPIVTPDFHFVDILFFGIDFVFSFKPSRCRSCWA